MNSNTLQVPKYKQRLLERERLLEQKADDSIRQLKRKKEFLQENGKDMITDEIVVNVSEKNSFLGKVANKILGGDSIKNTAYKQKRSQRSSGLLLSDGVLSRFSRMGSVLIPMLYTIGERKLLSYSFRGAGKLIRFTLRNLFGLKRKRRR
ncbi:hypothetical protein QYZ87_06365 [Porphyromonadaceae bacterium W3.11]|nr:hypothetical protein [Porphyromonadaceae bacterium W3.11]